MAALDKLTQLHDQGVSEIALFQKTRENPVPPRRRVYLKKRAIGVNSDFVPPPPPKNQFEQVLRWLDGVSYHCGDTCTPDFSCCYPELKAGPDLRWKYFDAFCGEDWNTTRAMDLMFYSAAAARLNPDWKVSFDGFAKC